jgi:phosphatidate cytidylyltransferase
VGRHSASDEDDDLGVDETAVDDPAVDETAPAHPPTGAHEVVATSVAPVEATPPARPAESEATSEHPAHSDTGRHKFEALTGLASDGGRSESAGRREAHGSVAVLTHAELESEPAPTGPDRASSGPGPASTGRDLEAIGPGPESTGSETASTGLEPAPKASRAGRNLPAAIGVSLALGAVIIASLLLYRPSFVAIVCIAMAYGSYEMVRAIGAAEARPPLVPLVAGGVAMDVAAWYQGANALVLGLLLTVLGVTVWRLAEGAVGYARDVTSAAFIALYVPLLGGFAVLLTHYSDGAGRVIAFIATVVCSDVGGYTAGVLFGRHPMAPTVSPKKSWEGFVGSAIACSIGGALFMSLLFHHHWWIGVLYGLAIAVTATLGDLGESMVKRDLGVKDMGRLLPGHGGLMDRLDSLLPCAAVAYLIMAAALV